MDSNHAVMRGWYVPRRRANSVFVSPDSWMASDILAPSPASGSLVRNAIYRPPLTAPQYSRIVYTTDHTSPFTYRKQYAHMPSSEKNPKNVIVAVRLPYRLHLLLTAVQKVRGDELKSDTLRAAVESYVAKYTKKTGPTPKS